MTPDRGRHLVELARSHALGPVQRAVEQLSAPLLEHLADEAELPREPCARHGMFPS